MGDVGGTAVGEQLSRCVSNGGSSAAALTANVQQQKPAGAAVYQFAICLPPLPTWHVVWFGTVCCLRTKCGSSSCGAGGCCCNRPLCSDANVPLIVHTAWKGAADGQAEVVEAVHSAECCCCSSGHSLQATVVCKLIRLCGGRRTNRHQASPSVNRNTNGSPGVPSSSLRARCSGA